MFSGELPARRGGRGRGSQWRGNSRGRGHQSAREDQSNAHFGDSRGRGGSRYRGKRGGYGNRGGSGDRGGSANRGGGGNHGGSGNHGGQANQERTYQGSQQVNNDGNGRPSGHSFESFNRGRPNQFRGGERGRGGKHPAVPINYHVLKAQLTEEKSPQDLILFCIGSSFVKLLEGGNEGSLKKDWVDMMLTVINKSFRSGQESRDLQQELSYLLLHDATADFLTKLCIKRFRDEMTSSGEMMRVDLLINSLSNYLEIYNYLCNFDPSALTTLMPCLKELAGQIMFASMEHEQLTGIMHDYTSSTAAAVKSEREAAEIKKMQVRAQKSGREEVNVRPLGDFRDIPVYPTKEDLIIKPQIRKNKATGDFQDVDDYLDTQFRLLREDFISTMRNGIKDYRENPNLTGANRFRSGDVKAYDGLYITHPCFSRDGLTYKVKFQHDHPYLSRINWKSSKRLIHGSMLCFSDNGFKSTILFATIAESDPEKIKKEGFEIQFLPESLVDYEQLKNQKGPFLAVESTAYFEAYTHILSGMQNINPNRFPLQQYIIKCEMNVSYPAYLRTLVSTFRFISQKNTVTQLVNLTSYESKWPEAVALGLNESQYLAFKSALTQEMSVIQGPPGTGKTYVGLKVMETILYNLYGVAGNMEGLSKEQKSRLLVQRPRNMSRLQYAKMSSSSGCTDRYEMCGERKVSVPVLVVCFTNHALDQFLEGILKFCTKDDVVRVGGRSKNEVLADCNLRVHNRRNDRSYELRRRYQELWRQKEDFEMTSNVQYVRKQMNLSGFELLFHDTPNFILESEFAFAFWSFAQAIQYNGYQPQEAMRVWLQCDIYSQAYNHQSSKGGGRDFLPDGIQEVQEEEAEPTIDVVGEAEREREQRTVQGGDHDDDQWYLKFTEGPVNEKDMYLAEPAPTTDEGWTEVQHRHARRMIQHQVQMFLADNNRMSPAEVEVLLNQVRSGQYDITYHMPLHERWRLYRFWLWRYQNHLADRLHHIQQLYNRICKQQKALRKVEDQNTLATAKVVGMTTTGAARYQDVLQGLKPKIVIVEEAAEVLEAHITTALSESCEQLILIGDHKQLKPNPTVYELAKDYNLDVSLFERLINNGFPVVTLDTQHRMRPEVSIFMKHIYDKLDNHQSVYNREPIRGLSNSVQLFNHKHPEKSDIGTMSHSNEFEANMIANLTRYLISQNYKPGEITIIAMYTGQLLLLKSLMPRTEFNGVTITSVDNFQGEENTIVIVSLVRCNDKDALGFVKIENRICVALSRAKYGMYVFGDFDMLSRGSSLWRKITEEARTAGALATSFTLSCVKHGNKAVVSKPLEFKQKAPIGGCTQICDETLSCSHKCTRPCHITDPDHAAFKCLEKCLRKLVDCDHTCPLRCHQVCRPCMVPKPVTLPCLHVRTVMCHIPNDSVMCVEPCPKLLPNCAHKCREKCSKPCTDPCKQHVDEACSRCGEIKKVPCYISRERLVGNLNQTLYQCDTRCPDILSCGHKCKGTCYECKIVHISCMETCGKILPCGHVCQGICSDCSANGHPPCKDRCGVQLTCKHICNGVCSDCCSHKRLGKHPDCQTLCAKQLECGHRCDKQCYQCSENGQCLPCTQRCLLRCSHDVQCQKNCQDECFYPHNMMGCTRGCRHDKCQRSCKAACSHTPCDKDCERPLHCRKCRQDYPCPGLCGEPCPYICPTCDLPRLLNQVKDIPDLKTTDGMRWIYLTDCRHRIPQAYMDIYVRSKPAGSLITCPFLGCGNPVLNTPRYIPLTRLRKNKQNGQLAKTSASDRKKQRQGDWKKKGTKDGPSVKNQVESKLKEQDKPKPLTRKELYEVSKKMRETAARDHVSWTDTSGSELDRMKRQLDEGEQNIQLLQTENEVRLAKIQASQSAEADIDELVHDMNLEEESEDSEYEYEEESDD